MTVTTNVAPARRSFLALLTGAVAAPAAAAPAVTPPKPVVEEMPELLALGRTLDSLIDELRTAVARKAEAADIWERTRPEVPDELIERPRDQMYSLCDFVAGADGCRVGTRKRYTSKDLRIHLIRFDVSGRSKEGRRLHRLLRLAKSYESGILEAYRVSDYEECNYNVHVAAGKVSALAGDLLKMEPVTVEGLLICARLTAFVGETVELGTSQFTLLAALGERTARAATRILSPTAI